MDHKRCNLCFFLLSNFRPKKNYLLKRDTIDIFQVRTPDSFQSHSLPVVGQVVEATFDESHSDLSVGEPTDERTQQLLCLVNQTLRQMNLQTHRQTLVHTESWSV